MRFLTAALVALICAGGFIFSGVDAKRSHHRHNPLFSATAPTEVEVQDMFTAFMKQYNKKYSHDEFSSRYETFKQNVDIIRTHNSKGNASWTMGLNEFADLTFAEFRGRFGYKYIKNDFLRSKNAPHQYDESVKLPDAVDWRTKQAVTPVKNQGQCGSCWAFSTTGSTEGAWALAGNALVSLSEQQLVDCSTAEGNQGCNGGLMDQAFNYIHLNKGIGSEAAYPYTGTQGTCQSTPSVAHISKWYDVPALNEEALQSAVAQQPVSVAIEADQLGFQFYSGGVFSGQCGTTLDHGVLIVGYGTDATSKQNYWIVKNSWGASWGESGYIRLIRGQNQCGINQQPSYPIV